MVADEQAVKQRKRNLIWASVIGAGMALSPIHNLWLTELATNFKGETVFFLPAFGTLLWLMGSLMFLLYNYRNLDWGSRKILIPLCVIIAAIGLSGITADSLMSKFAPFFMGLSMLAIYLVARKLGKDIFLPLAIGAAVASLGILIQGVLHPGVITGGLVFERNYDIATGFVLLGAALFIHRYQWVLASLALLAMLVCGAPEAVFALVVLVAVVLVRRDWSRRLLYALVPVVITAIMLLSTGYGYSLYKYAGFIVKEEVVQQQGGQLYADDGTTPIGRKWQVARTALVGIKPLGDGYSVTDFRRDTVHNVPLIIVQQLGWPGVLAALMWLWVSVYCLVKTRWKYVWLLILSLSVFDHFVWTQLAPLWWAVVGASTAGSVVNSVSSDLIFKRFP